MKTIFILAAMLTAMLLTGCSSAEVKEKNLEIIGLQIELASQHGARAAEIEYAEQQVAFYLGCKAFFNRCSPETIERGEKLLQNGYTGTTSLWYWVDLISWCICIAIAGAVFMALIMRLYLTILSPKADEVERARKLVAKVNEYVAAGERRVAELEQQELAKTNYLAKVKSEIKKQIRARNEAWQSFAEVIAELEYAKEKCKAAEQKKMDAENSEDY